jgi:hypothetical protein
LRQISLDEAAEPDSQVAQLPSMALELFGMGIRPAITCLAMRR